MSSVVLRCTAKVLNLLGSRPGDLVTAEPTDDDWYANLLWLDRRKCLLFVHAGTLFSVFVPDIRKGDVVPIGPMVVRLVTDELRAEGLPLDRFGALDPNSVDVAKTASKTVLGYMNEIGRFCEYAVADSGGLARCEVEDLNRELRRQLHLSRQPPGYFVPIKLAQGSSRRRTAVQSRPSPRIVD
jgi:hypothetical protein